MNFFCRQEAHGGEKHAPFRGTRGCYRINVLIYLLHTFIQPNDSLQRCRSVCTYTLRSTILTDLCGRKRKSTKKNDEKMLKKQNVICIIYLICFGGKNRNRIGASIELHDLNVFYRV